MGGTANLAVLGGNVPPSRARQLNSLIRESRMSKAWRLVAHRNGPVARSTLNPTAHLRLKRPLAAAYTSITRFESVPIPEIWSRIQSPGWSVN